MTTATTPPLRHLNPSRSNAVVIAALIASSTKLDVIASSRSSLPPSLPSFPLVPFFFFFFPWSLHWGRVCNATRVAHNMSLCMFLPLHSCVSVTRESLVRVRFWSLSDL